MACVPRGLAVLGLVIALAGAAQLAAAAPVGTIRVAQDDVNPDAPTDMPIDMPIDTPPDMLTEGEAEIPTATPTPSPTATPTPSPTATPTATPIPAPILIQQVLQRSNDEQVQAIATRNLSLIAGSVTGDYARDLANVLQDMIDHKVTSIALLKLDWGPIVVATDGRSAVATTYETWRIVSEFGSVDDEPHRNDYALVLDNATWKIKANMQVLVPPTPTPAPR